MNQNQYLYKRSDNNGVISTKNKTRYHQVPNAEQEQHSMITNNEIILPSIALLTVDNGTSLSCDHFFLSGLKISTNKFLPIIENKTINYVESILNDLYQSMNNETHINILTLSMCSNENFLLHISHFCAFAPVRINLVNN
jgi:hypothetical protein